MIKLSFEEQQEEVFLDFLSSGKLQESIFSHNTHILISFAEPNNLIFSHLWLKFTVIDKNEKPTQPYLRLSMPSKLAIVINCNNFKFLNIQILLGKYFTKINYLQQNGLIKLQLNAPLIFKNKKSTLLIKQNKNKTDRGQDRKKSWSTTSHF